MATFKNTALAYGQLQKLLDQLRYEEFGGQPECAETDPELFFPFTTFEGRTLASETEKVNQAKAICAGCPIAQACQDFAVRNGMRGIWGGTTDDERAGLRQGQVASVPMFELPEVA